MGACVIPSDLAIAARTGRIESGQPLWKRLTYVAITRAQHQLNGNQNRSRAKNSTGHY